MKNVNISISKELSEKLKAKVKEEKGKGRYMLQGDVIVQILEEYFN